MHAGNIVNVGGCIKRSSISLSGASISVSCVETVNPLWNYYRNDYFQLGILMDLQAM